MFASNTAMMPMLLNGNRRGLSEVTLPHVTLALINLDQVINEKV